MIEEGFHRGKNCVRGVVPSRREFCQSEGSNRKNSVSGRVQREENCDSGRVSTREEL